MTTDFRALCAELLLALEGEGYTHWIHSPDEDDLVLRARAALAEAVPEGREPASVTKQPTVMQLIELSDEIEVAGLGQIDFARAVLARWGNPAPQPVPVSERWPEFSDPGLIADLLPVLERAIGRINRSIHSHWLPANALPIPTVND